MFFMQYGTLSKCPSVTRSIKQFIIKIKDNQNSGILRGTIYSESTLCYIEKKSLWLLITSYLIMCGLRVITHGSVVGACLIHADEYDNLVDKTKYKNIHAFS